MKPFLRKIFFWDEPAQGAFFGLTLLICLFIVGLLSGCVSQAEAAKNSSYTTEVLSNELNPIRPFLRSSMTGDILILSVIQRDGALVLQKAITLSSPYFEKIPQPYEEFYYQPIIKSKCLEQGKPRIFDLEIGHLVISQNNNVLFIPLEVLDNVALQWKNTRGYAAYMENSDLDTWISKELASSPRSLKMDKYGTLIWEFPLLKEKYTRMNIFWDSQSTREFAVAFFNNLSSEQAGAASWKLYSKFGVCHGWQK